MSNYTPKNEEIEALIDEVLNFTRQSRMIFLQKLIFVLVKHDNKILIPLLHKAGVSTTQIAEAIGVNQSVISTEYLKKEEKNNG